jgi:tetratricopeptide (TPR) repeat protein
MTEPSSEHAVTTSTDNAKGVEGQDVVAATNNNNEVPATEAGLTQKYDLATSLFTQGELNQAETLFRQVLEGRSKLLGDKHADTLSTMHALASLLSLKGNLQEAESLYRHAYEGRKLILDTEKDPLIWESSHNLATTLFEQGELDEAEYVFRNTVTGRQCVLGNTHEDTLLSTHRLAVVLLQKRKFDEAERLFRVSSERTQHLLGGVEVTATLSSMQSDAEMLVDHNNYSEAKLLLEKVLSLRRLLLPHHHLDTLSTMKWLLSVHIHSRQRISPSTAVFKCM